MKRAEQFEQMTYYVECPYCGHLHSDDAGWVDRGDTTTGNCDKCGVKFEIVSEKRGDREE